MRFTPFLVALVSLSVAYAGVIPTAGGNTTVAQGQGGPSGSASSVNSQPSGVPTGAPLHSIPNPTSAHSRHSGAPTRVSGHPAPSVHTSSRGAQPTQGHSGSANPHNAIANGTHPHPSTWATGVSQLHGSGVPCGASNHSVPTHIANGTHPHPSTLATGVSQPHRSGVPSGASIHSVPSASPVGSGGAHPSNAPGQSGSAAPQQSGN